MYLITFLSSLFAIFNRNFYVLVIKLDPKMSKRFFILFIFLVLLFPVTNRAQVGSEMIYSVMDQFRIEFGFFRVTFGFTDFTKVMNIVSDFKKCFI